MIKILFNDKKIILTPALHESTTHAFIYFNINEDKALDILDLLMISELNRAIIVGDVNANLAVLKKAFLFLRAGGGLVISPQNEILFIFRKGKWDLPKGKLDKGETIEECAVREVQEETGLHGARIKQHLINTYHIYYDKTFILKETSWFLMTSNIKRVFPQREEGISKVMWVAVPKLKYQIKNTYESVVDVVARLNKIV